MLSPPRSSPPCCSRDRHRRRAEAGILLGVRSIRVAAHCTEADITAQHITMARELGMDVSGFLMLSHMASAETLAEQAKLMETFGAHCVYVTDSGGRLTMPMVRDRVRLTEMYWIRTPRSAYTPMKTFLYPWPTVL